jgi:hypothetical protein
MRRPPRQHVISFARSTRPIASRAKPKGGRTVDVRNGSTAAFSGYGCLVREASESGHMRPAGNAAEVT